MCEQDFTGTIILKNENDQSVSDITEHMIYNKTKHFKFSIHTEIIKHILMSLQKYNNNICNFLEYVKWKYLTIYISFMHVFKIKYL